MIEMSLLKRLWIYQKERFPLSQHGFLIVVFTFSAAAFSRLCRGEESFVDLHTFTIGVVTTFLIFFLLRLLDEFKDAEDDARFRPYRPVPRGLVSFRELKILIILAILAIIVLNLVYLPALLIAVFIIFFYLFFMTKEFFVPQWLKSRPLIYMFSHMLIMPLIDIYTTGLDWLIADYYPPAGVDIFLIVSFFNGMVLEIGRKIRLPKDEEEGVQTYSADFGVKKALVLWLIAVTVTFLFALFASTFSTQALLSIILLSLIYPVCLGVGITFYLKLPFKSGKVIENMAGIWTLAMYLILGGTPMIVNFIKNIL